ncbi:Hypothetical predicted protein [Paramuricea clavata]|uniref:Uncharacterized protein n=1 Tax=Paramuricea clavata TaxID=317549 RepID=A0A6S7K0U6_PARCT|nr:Hypothetical predicted protein [Paramuricea clavata]
MGPLNSKDIKNKLKSLANSATGKDRVEYRHLKLVDPDCKILSIIYNKCLAEKKIPSSWKESATIMIYKKGSSDDPSNFRPIAFTSCLCKLFTSLLALRVTNFSIQNNLMSPQQKSARPAEGCHGHTFTLQSIVADCKQNQKNCFFIWLDLRNAFETEPIKVTAGVKQGCPISPVLFNLTSELLIRTALSRSQDNPSIPFKLHNQPISILAYADDLVLISRTREGLQVLLDDISLAADVLNLSFRQDKCSTLSLTCFKKDLSRVSEYEFIVQHNPIPFLKREESYRYLGVPIGLLYDAKDIQSITAKLISDLDKIRDSLLAPWQRLDAIRTFVQPGLTYALISCPVTHEALKEYRSKLIEVLKSIYHLPKHASASYFFADKSDGGLGFLDRFDKRHVQTIVHTVKILSAKDPLIHNISRAQLRSVVYCCINVEPYNND